MAERCEMCGDAITDGGTGRLHDTYDCAESLLAQRSVLVSRIAKLEAVVAAADRMRRAEAVHCFQTSATTAYDAAKAELERVKGER